MFGVGQKESVSDFCPFYECKWSEDISLTDLMLGGYY